MSLSFARFILLNFLVMCKDLVYMFIVSSLQVNHEDERESWRKQN